MEINVKRTFLKKQSIFVSNQSVLEINVKKNFLKIHLWSIEIPDNYSCLCLITSRVAACLETT